MPAQSKHQQVHLGEWITAILYQGVEEIVSEWVWVKTIYGLLKLVKTVKSTNKIKTKTEILLYI